MSAAEPTPEQKFALEYARHLVEHGMPVFLAPPALTQEGKWDPTGGTDGLGYHLPQSKWQQTVADSRVLDDWEPGVAICAVTGQGVDVIDVDPRNDGDEGFARMRAEGLMPNSYGRQRTPSGGTHDFVSALGVRKLTNFRPGVDLQAGDSDGHGRGFVFLAPTVRKSKVSEEVVAYEWDMPPDLDALDLIGADPTSAALADAVRAYRTPVATREQAEIDLSSPPSADEVRKAAAVLAKAEKQMFDAEEGSRNDTLIRLLPKLYQFVLGECLDEAEVEERMRSAAAKAGIGDEYENTSESAWVYANRDGADRPYIETAADDFRDEDGAVTEATAGPIKRFQRMNLAELLDPDRPPREYVVEPMIAAGSSVSLVAPAGARKSLVLLAIALAVARGDEDFAGMAIPRGRRVLYVDMENTEDDLRERLLSFGVTPGDQLDRFILLSLPSMDPLDSAKGGREFTEAVDSFGLEPGDMVVLDSYQRITEAGENDSDTARGYYRHTGMALKARGLTVVRTDNTGKDASRGARGSSGKRDDVDIEYLMESRGDFIDIKTGKARQRGVSAMTLRVRVEDERTTFHSDQSAAPHSRTRACVRVLDEMAVPNEAGERKAAAALKDSEVEFPRTVIRDAVKLRQNRAVEVRRAFTTSAEEDTAPTKDGAVRRGEGSKG
ncbi:AAA family ATPase [Aeromicrobium endophyticum]|uniref:DNA primase/polymerase bifunctional N-terminal domain-containing protein n=1 Tax=Aeromicrobium endophyticum TaxID=2292704 RepID=A0A371P8D2_9ACTN|nr:AAA family ATPase [Aeromicrobium endophyticum]REK72135.1 hypothetical protein DX116_00325 [Aeromicrobium endophyticum]